METSENSVEQKPRSRNIWLNHIWIKAFLVGFVVGSGGLMGSILMIYYFPDLETQVPTWFELMLNVGFPILVIVIVVYWTERLLERFGFVGFPNIQDFNNEGMLPLIFATLGFFLGGFLVHKVYVLLYNSILTKITPIWVLGALLAILLLDLTKKVVGRLQSRIRKTKSEIAK